MQNAPAKERNQGYVDFLYRGQYDGHSSLLFELSDMLRPAFVLYVTFNARARSDIACHITNVSSRAIFVRHVGSLIFPFP